MLITEGRFVAFCRTLTKYILMRVALALPLLPVSTTSANFFGGTSGNGEKGYGTIGELHCKVTWHHRSGQGDQDQDAQDVVGDKDDQGCGHPGHWDNKLTLEAQTLHILLGGRGPGGHLSIFFFKFMIMFVKIKGIAFGVLPILILTQKETMIYFEWYYISFSEFFWI